MPRRPETPQVTPLGPEPDRTGGERGRQPRVVVLLAAGATAFALLMLVFGAGGGNDQETPPSTVPEQASEAESPNMAITTTTTTLPPTLAQVAPEIAAELAIVTTQTKARALQWTGGGEAPRHRPVPADTDWAAFDADGEHLAYTDPDGLSVGDAFSSEATIIVPAATGAVWHASLPGVMAFTAPGPEAVTLTVARLDRDPGRGIETSDVAELPHGSRVVAWGSWGYAIEQPLPGSVDADARVVVVYDRTGRDRLRAVPGTVVTAGSDLLLVAGPENVAEAMRVAESAGIAAHVVQAGEGNRLLDTELTPVTPALVGDPARLPTVTIAPDGSAIAVSARTSPGGTSVSLMARDSRSSMIVPVEGSVAPIGFVAGSGYLLLHDEVAAELVLINTETGRRARLPLGEGTVLAAHA